MRICLFCSGFTVSQIRLQPWLTLAQVGERLRARGHDLSVATDQSDGHDLPLPTVVFPSLRALGPGSLRQWLREVSPDICVAAVSPFSLVTSRWHHALPREKAWAYLPYALYTRKEVGQAWPHLTWRERYGYARNIPVPGWLWRRRLKERFAGIVCQSTRTATRVGSGVQVSVIPPGVDLDRWRPADRMGSASGGAGPSFVYLGSVKALRGFRILLEAMRQLPQTVRLRVLARGMSEVDADDWRRRLESLGLQDRVTIRSGWLSVEELRVEIAGAIAVVLPFILVPSELPVSVLEVLACGTPVIATDIDGLPESVGDAGLIVPPADAPALARAMQFLAGNPEQVARLREACQRRREKFLNWDQVADRWAETLGLVGR